MKGLIQGNARGYVKEIFAAFRAAGYECQLFLLNAAAMGVPQRRERVFFISRRQELNFKNIELSFSEIPITFNHIKHGSHGKGLSPAYLRLWEKRRKWDNDLGAVAKRIDGKPANWNHKILHDDKTSLTIASAIRPILYSQARRANDEEIIDLQSFPIDYDFSQEDAGYVCGMSVPPLMMQRLALEIARQWLLAPNLAEPN